MKALVIGAGMIGSALAYDLIHSNVVDDVVLADKDEHRARDIATKIGARVSTAQLDVRYYDDVVALMHGMSFVLGATSYTHNVVLTTAAIEAGVHFCDLGGNMDVVHRQMTLSEKAKNANVLILPNCGLAPGMACVIAAGAAHRFERIDCIAIRVGGLPQHPLPPLNYQLVFSAEGLINEYLEPAEAIRKGARTTVPSMEDIESLAFPPPFGTLEAFNTSGGASTLPQMFEGKVRELDYKTIRYKGHCEKFKTLLELGFASSEPVMAGSQFMTTREFFENLLRKRLPSNEPDAVLMRVTVAGSLEGRNGTLAYEMIDYYDTKLQMTSMMRTTAFPTSILAQLIIQGQITARGVMPPEQCTPLVPFMEQLASRNIVVTETRS